MKSTIRFCDDIGMFAYDRSREQSCIHATAFCKGEYPGSTPCFNAKLERAFGYTIAPKDVRNDAYWAQLTGPQVKRDLARRRNQTTRVRLMTRGEAFADVTDVYRVKDILQHSPATTFWIPTRAWRDKLLRTLIAAEIRPLKNARVLASIDPSNSETEIASLTANNWSTMFYGDDSATGGRYKCPKTFNHASGHCAKCVKGCFSAKRVDVLLKAH